MLFRSVFIASALIASSFAAGPRCTPAERNVWIGSQPFADHYDGCSRSALGSPVGTVACMSPLYPALTHGCLECFGQATQCGGFNCAPLCMGNSAAPECLNCISTHCMPAMRTCVGAASDAELPNTPSPREATTRRPARTRPAAAAATSTDAPATTTTTTTESATVSSTAAGSTTTESTSASTTTVEPSTTTTEDAASTTTEVVTTTIAESTTTETEATTTQAEATTPGPAADSTTTTTNGASLASTLAACFVLIGVSALM